jgi:putative restriction endonuclease
MRFWVGVTDPGWYRFHRDRSHEEVNFWQPSERAPFKNLPEGAPFLFKLKGAANAIAGGGTYVTTQVLPLSVMWEVFGPQNGAASPRELRALIDPGGLTRQSPRQHVCQLITGCWYLPEDRWLVAPAGFATNLVRGKYYDEHDGKHILDHVRPWMYGAEVTVAERDVYERVDRPKYGAPQLVRPRLGQSGFRMRLFEAYHKTCAITGENTLPTLDAAHIVPYNEAGGSHDLSNGLLLRTDFHRLFDDGLVTVEPDLTIRVSPRIRASYFNGKAYYRLDGQPLRAPSRPEWRPDPDKLRWHNMERFQR